VNFNLPINGRNERLFVIVRAYWSLSFTYGLSGLLVDIDNRELAIDDLEIIVAFTLQWANDCLHLRQNCRVLGQLPSLLVGFICGPVGCHQNHNASCVDLLQDSDVGLGLPLTERPFVNAENAACRETGARSPIEYYADLFDGGEVVIADQSLGVVNPGLDQAKVDLKAAMFDIGID
jgi:hypothetical protein